MCSHLFNGKCNPNPELNPNPNPTNPTNSASDPIRVLTVFACLNLGAVTRRRRTVEGKNKGRAFIPFWPLSGARDNEKEHQTFVPLAMGPAVWAHAGQ